MTTEMNLGTNKETHKSFVDANREKYKSLVGKHITLMTIGKEVKGTVISFSEDKHGFNLEVDHEPVNWGGEIYVKSHPFARKMDDWGSLNHVKEINGNH